MAHASGFRILDETPDHIVVEKPAPLLVHPSTPGNPPTLLDGLQGLLAYDIANGARLSIINRLDRETSGIVLVAKNARQARRFHLAMQRRQVGKQYGALALGWPEWESHELDAPILPAREIGPSRIYVKQAVHPDGSPSRTVFEVIGRFTSASGARFSHIRCLPHTGRMHQIRVHLSHLGHPVVGDKIYGPDETCYLDFVAGGWTPDLRRRLTLRRHALHSTHLSLPQHDPPLAWESSFPEGLLSEVEAELLPEARHRSER